MSKYIDLADCGQIITARRTNPCLRCYVGKKNLPCKCCAGNGTHYKVLAWEKQYTGVIDVGEQSDA